MKKETELQLGKAAGSGSGEDGSQLEPGPEPARSPRSPRSPQPARDLLPLSHGGMRCSGAAVRCASRPCSPRLTRELSRTKELLQFGAQTAQPRASQASRNGTGPKQWPRQKSRSLQEKSQSLRRMAKKVERLQAPPPAACGMPCDRVTVPLCCEMDCTLQTLHICTLSRL